MGADIKALRTRIKSVDSTLHLTKAMGLVASSKIRRATESMLRGREYLASLERVMDSLTSCPECRKSPYMRSSGENARTRMIIIAGDRGLAGGYNANVFKLWKTLSKGESCTVLPVGRKALEFFEKNGTEILNDSFKTVATIGIGDCQTMGRLLCRGFRNKEFDKVVLVYTDFVSMLQQVPKSITVLPFKDGYEEDRKDNSDKNLENKKALSGFMFDDDPEKLLLHIVPQYVGGALYSALCESAASEYGARRTAMDSANKNAEEFIDALVLQYNRARQAIITQEITEIVSGAEAL